MALSRLDLALVAIAAVGLMWIEHNHRIVIGPMAADKAPGPAASPCPETDNAPLSAACVKFIGDGVSRAVRPGPPAWSPYSQPVTRSGSAVLAAPDGY